MIQFDRHAATACMTAMNRAASGNGAAFFFAYGLGQREDQPDTNCVEPGILHTVENLGVAEMDDCRFQAGPVR